MYVCVYICCYTAIGKDPFGYLFSFLSVGPTAPDLPEMPQRGYECKTVVRCAQ